MSDDEARTPTTTAGATGSSNTISAAQTPMIRGEVFRVGIKPPVFCKEQPDLYFIQMESQFAVAGISLDQTKYHHVISSLEAQYLLHVAEIIRNPPANDKYNAVKIALINEFTDSDQKKLRKLINEMELGDLRPSQLLKRMKELANGKMNDDVVKSLWIARLPDSIRSVVTIVDGDSTTMAKQADKMLEVQSFSSVSSVSSVSSIQTLPALHAEIQELRNQISQMRTNNYNENGKSNDEKHNHSRSRSKSKVHFPFCRYHYRFGDKAKKCIEPCQFKKLSTAEN